MYKSIVFDLGGVMIDFDPRGYLVDRLCNAETEEEVYDLTFGSEEWKLLDAGLISRFDGNHRMLEKFAFDDTLKEALPALPGRWKAESPMADARRPSST